MAKQKLYLSISAVVVAVILVILPWVVYAYSLNLLPSKPVKPTQSIPNIEFLELWNSKEPMQPSQSSKITPYWFYRWLIAGTLSDYIADRNESSTYANVSNMSGEIAINHMRSIQFNPGGMLWWHISHACLTVWIQRNWSAQEIAAKFREIDA